MKYIIRKRNLLFSLALVLSAQSLADTGVKASENTDSQVNSAIENPLETTSLSETPGNDDIVYKDSTITYGQGTVSEKTANADSSDTFVDKETVSEVDASDLPAEVNIQSRSTSTFDQDLYDRVVVPGKDPGAQHIPTPSSEGMIVERLSGSNRYSTAVAVSRSGWSTSKYVFIANGERFPDALTGAPLASIYNAPLLLSRQNKIEDTTLKEIERLQSTHVTILGGELAISNDVFHLFSQLGYQVRRIGGRDRYHQAALVADEIRRHKGDNQDAFLATGQEFADAMSISPIAADKQQAIYLTRPNALNEHVINSVPKVKNWIIIGGPVAISAQTENDLKDYGGNVIKRFSGRDRYDVNQQIINYYDSQGHAYIASGQSFPDALTASLLANVQRSSLLLVNNHSATIKRQIVFAVNRHHINHFTIVGGPMTITGPTEASFKWPKIIITQARIGQILAEARQWIGTVKWDKNHRFMVDTYNSVKPLPVGYPLKYKDDWCDAFITFLAIRTNMTHLIGRECGVERHVNIFKQKEIWNEDGTVTPKPGDLIVFSWEGNRQPNDKFSSHIGIVEDIDLVNQRIRTIEGNIHITPDKKTLGVGRKSWQIGDGSIRGFARPRY